MSRGTDWALITGAGSGIGAALAQALAARGVGVVLVGRRRVRLMAVRESLSRWPRAGSSGKRGFARSML